MIIRPQRYEPGYYWVFYSTGWEPASFDEENVWQIIGDPNEYSERDFEYIGPKVEFAPTLIKCGDCGKEFWVGSGTGRRSTSSYCSNRCKLAAKRKMGGGPQ